MMTHVMRWTVLALATALVVGCSSGPAEVDDVPVEAPESPSDVAPSGATTTSPGATGSDDRTSGSSTATDGATSASGGQGDGGGTEGARTAQLTPVDDDGPVGANGRAMLRSGRRSLVLEIDVQSGVQVDDDAVSHLVAVLSGVTAVPDGVRLAGGNTFDSDRTSWTASDLRRAARANRTTSSTDQQLSVHVLYVRGSHVADGEETQAIGLAYSASTAAVFPDRWSGLGTLLGSSEAIERAVLVHEFGHLFGLVNLTYTSAIDHEDPDHPGHSDSQGSVMYHAIETTAVGQVFNGPPPDRFDDADRADLEGLRTGRY